MIRGFFSIPKIWILGDKNMADKRMFAKSIVDSDLFLEMPISARLLYYDLGMRADDEGFVNSPKKIMRMIGATTDDMNILIARQFIIPFDSGIVVIRHWRIHNYIRNDRKHITTCTQEKALLDTNKNGEYMLKQEGAAELESDDIEGQMVLECQSDDGQMTVTCPPKTVSGKSSKKKKTEEDHLNEVDALFERLWKIYVRKEGKSAVTKTAKEDIFKIGYERMEKCIQNYAQQKKGSEKQYVLMGSTFFNGRYKDYLVDELEDPIVDSTEQSNTGQVRRQLQ